MLKVKCLFFIAILLSGHSIIANASKPLAFDSANTAIGKELKLTRITPKGDDVPVGRQIVFQFDRPVVPVGRMDREASEIPINITPALNCEWRWLNTSALSCNLTEDNQLKYATHYRITVNPGIKTDAAVMDTRFTHEFITARPKVKRTRFQTWRSPGLPKIQVTFNQPVSQSSVGRYLHFLIKGRTDKYQIDVEPDKNDRQTPFILPLPGEGLALYGAQAAQQVDDRLSKVKGEEARRVWVISPRRELPLDTSIDLFIDPGLVSAWGPESGIESKRVVNFQTFPEFRFLGVRCSVLQKSLTGSDKIVSRLLPPNELAQKGSFSIKNLVSGIFKDTDSEAGKFTEKCLPLKPVSLAFTAPVINEVVKENITVTPDLAGGRKDYDPWLNKYSYSYLNWSHRPGREYTVSFPELLKAFQAYELVSDTDKFHDEFGRKLPEPINMAFMTAHRLPDLRLTHRKAVLEKQVDTDVPIYVTNLKEVKVTHDVLTADGKQSSQQIELPIPQAQDVAFAERLGVRKMLDGKSGVVKGTLNTKPIIKHGYGSGWSFFAQVTPFQVHVKLGHFNSLVWVTDMATGKPVSGAKVRIYEDTYHSLSADADNKASAKTNKSGVAILPGTEQLTPDLKLLKHLYRENSPRLFVRVDKGDDLALVPLDYNFETRTSGIWSSNRKIDGHMHTWGTTAQGVYKAGDKVQFKFYVRNQSNKHWVAPRLDGYTLDVIDPKGKSVHKAEDLTLSEFGAYDGQFTLSEQGAVGWYQFRLKSNFSQQTFTPMRVLVSDFTPSPFRVSSNLNGDLFQPGDRIEIDTLAKLHSGGPYTDAQTRITARLKSTVFSSSEPIAKGFRFDSHRGYRNQITVHQNTGNVNDNGEFNDGFELKDQGIIYGKLNVESAVRDDRGKYITSAAYADYVGRNRFVGLKNTRWLYEEDQTANVQYLVVDETGKPVSDTGVTIKIEREETKASQVKGAGNAYLTNYITEWVQAAECKGMSKLEPLDCEYIPEAPGSYRMTATIKDTQGRSHSTQLSSWVVGKGRVVWQQPTNSNLQIIPEKTDYKIGENARYLVKNPYPGAKALITVERYGVLKHWAQTLEGSAPVIEFPVEPDYLPGFYLSVLVVSPRVDKPLDENQVDLGKPAYKLGYVSVPVKDPYKEIEVKVSTDKDIYKPRETVRATIQAKPRHGAKKAPLELAVAVIDESVFDLNSSGRNYYDPYAGFNKLDRLDVNNYGLLSRLIGRQKFEKKGANAGGGGGPEGPGLSLRDLFKYIAYWNPALTVDRKGNADMEFELPDNLTGWRIFAWAVTREDRMGLGDVNFKVNRPTELRPVMPNQLVEGDRFLAGFSVMNRTNKVRELKVSIKASGALVTDSANTELEKMITLQPFKRESVWLPLQTKGAGEISFVAIAGDAEDQDAVTHSLPVSKRRSLQTAATYGTTTKNKVSDKVQFPDGIYTDVGGITVSLSPSVIGNVEGAFTYIRDYPYLCWEQRLTKGVMASHYNNLKSYLPDTLEWQGSDVLPQTMLDKAANYQAQNGGMTYWVPQNQYVSPYLSAYTAIAFNWLRSSGYQVPVDVEQKLHRYLDELLKRDVMPSFFTKGMSSTVRAVALAALSEHGKITLNDLQRYQKHIPEMSLFGKAHYLRAAISVDGAGSIIDQVADDILSHSSQSGGKFQFNEVWDDSYSYILATPLRSNCAVLSSLVSMNRTQEDMAKVGDIPFKLVRAITQTRGNRDHWENTQENLFCMNSLVDYNRVYEDIKPDMLVTAFTGNQKIGEAKFNDLRNPMVTIEDTVTKTKPGLKTSVKLEKQGEGRFYYSTRLSYALTEDNASRINSGIEIRREYSVERDGKWILLESPMKIKRGELVRVDIYLSLPTARHFVVVDDPVPGGLEPVNRDLATASAVDADKGEFKAAGGSWWFNYSDWQSYGVSRWSFYHKELRHDAARFYSDYLSAGNYHLSYTAQAIAEGEFSAMPIHSEEMYDPDVYGKGLPGTLNVNQ